MKISVIIITHNRKHQVDRTINAYLNQTYKNIEIIIIDNASKDGTKELIEQKYLNGQYEHIKYLWLPDNIDTRAINLGIEMSDGDIIWRTDDDSEPEDSKAFEFVVEKFNKYPDIHIIAAEIINVYSNNMVYHWHMLDVDKTNIPDNGYKTFTFIGCGAAIRKDVFNKVGFFWEFGIEEEDLSIRAIVNGFNIRYFPNLKVLHFASAANRNRGDRWVIFTKQYIRIFWKHYPLHLAIINTFSIIFFQTFDAIIFRIPLLNFLDGAFAFWSTLFHTIKHERNPIPSEMVKDVNLGISFTNKQIKLYKHKFKSLIEKKFKKNNQ
jgi:GT2 family glycosyltransferase